MSHLQGCLCPQHLLQGLVSQGQRDNQRELHQVSIMSALMDGVYEGEMTLAELFAKGDFGLGTFNELDGELIAFDGEAYQLRSDGSARPATGNQKTPYAVVTFFEPQLTLYVNSPVTRQALHHDIDAQIGSANVFCAIRIDGQFNHVRTRTVERQAPPFIPFTKAVEQQPLFDFAHAAGTLVGFRSPDFIQGIGVAGYHEHFITEQRHGGGHVIDFHLQHGSVQFGIISRLVVHFPTGEDFKHANLTPAFLDRDIRRVEQSS
ncbi:acetolactate decarboxylase [Pseudomonas lundensis]|uniref:acetolactate decarboxylase n=1 Tax=Pseudomonas lundensis TaxID=86185 RepID=UPI00089DD187|nr:acetolactate decarboxylase [Pseudomonas lundensis]